MSDPIVINKRPNPSGLARTSCRNVMAHSLPSVLLSGPGMVWVGWHLADTYAELINAELTLLTELPSLGAGEPLEPTFLTEPSNYWAVITMGLT